MVVPDFPACPDCGYLMYRNFGEANWRCGPCERGETSGTGQGGDRSRLRAEVATLRQRNADLLQRVEIAERERGAALAALRVIRDAYGQVCEVFGTCEHPACQASYSAWQVADAALSGGEV